nr:HyaD/HybD family hydrogenase maturation endopeptidase [uncultured Desulfobacter sp.]
MKSNLTVLGVGNILYSDDGVGVRVIEKLREEYRFSDNITLVDGGVQGLNLMDIILDAGRLIVVDTVLNNGQPGDIYRIIHEQAHGRLPAGNALHQADLIETLTFCTLLGQVPDTTIIGIEPKDYTTFSDQLTPPIQDRLADLTQKVLEEIVNQAGADEAVTQISGS